MGCGCGGKKPIPITEAVPPKSQELIDEVQAERGIRHATEGDEGFETEGDS